MATISTLANTVSGRGAFPALGDKVGLYEVAIDFAAARLANGGALLDDDIIQAITLPTGSLVLSAGMEVTALVVGATKLQLNLGINGDTASSVGASSHWSDAANAPFDIGTGGAQKAVGVYSGISESVANEPLGNPKVIYGTDTIDVTVQDITGDATAGAVRVWALVADIGALSG